MDYKHRHLREVFLSGRTVCQVNQQNPLVVLALKDTFFHFTLSTLLRIHGVSFVLRDVRHGDLDPEGKLMAHQLPAIAYGAHVLEYSQVCDFLSDLILGENEYPDFLMRKTELKRMMEVWAQIFHFEEMGRSSSSLEGLGVSTQKDYQNLVMRELLGLSMKFQDNHLQKYYHGYSQNDPNPENVLFADIITSILGSLPDTLPDFYLRAHFPALIDLGTRMRNKMEQLAPVRSGRHEVVLEEKSEGEKERWARWHVNSKMFWSAFAIMGGAYAIWTKE